MPSRTFKDKIVRLATLVTVDEPILSGYHFEGCTLRGPAVIHVISGVTMDGCRFDTGNAPTSALWWAVPAGAYALGALGLRDSTFVDCSFFGVGLVGPVEDRDKLLPGLGS